MKWMVATFAALAIVLLSAVTYHQQLAIEALVRGNAAGAATDLSVSKQTQSLQRRVDELERELTELNRRHDLVTAATHMGWGAAYRALRAGVLTEQTQQGE